LSACRHLNHLKTSIAIYTHHQNLTNPLSLSARWLFPQHLEHSTTHSPFTCSF
jgi:hypothetical protein